MAQTPQITWLTLSAGHILNGEAVKYSRVLIVLKLHNTETTPGALKIHND